jgi:hypothetical protein
VITTNLPEFINLLNQLGNVSVHDGGEDLELHVAKPVNVEDMDDLICDALFADPIGRTEGPHEWVVSLWKRDDLRSASDMRSVSTGRSITYELQKAA